MWVRHCSMKSLWQQTDTGLLSDEHFTVDGNVDRGGGQSQELQAQGW